MGHDELQEGCDVPVHTAGTRCRRKGNRSHGLGRRRLYCSNW